MFYGQNCSGRFGENRSVISVAGSKEDINIIRLLNELNLKRVKRDINQTYFSKAVELADKYSIKVSMVIVQNNKYFEWKRELCRYSSWFAKLYGIICAKALGQIKDKKIFLHMDREYDSRTLDLASDVVCQLLDFQKENVYIRKEGEHPTNRIVVADLFARGCFKGFDCNSFNIIKNPDIKNEIKEVFGKHR